MHACTSRHTDTQTHRHTDTQTHRHADRGRERERENEERETYTNTNAENHTHKNTHTLLSSTIPLHPLTPTLLLQVLCYRDASSTSPPSSSASLIMHIAIPEQRDSDTSAVGWEANAKGRMGARRVDLGPFMDPARRAVESADLNLKLMRWRFLPELDPDRLATVRVSVPCLLLGAGTLGCNVSRSLLSWGFRYASLRPCTVSGKRYSPDLGKITLVDYGKVSYSNPTRQWLFEYEDCIDPENPSEGKPKAQ
eukprot:1928283-Rhodomonas_salina.1